MSDEQTCENCGKPIGQHSWPGEFCVYGPEPKTSQWKPKERKMEKLTKERFDHLFGCLNRDALWLAIRDHLDAIHEETRAEVMKDHFKIDEEIEMQVRSGEWEYARVGVLLCSKSAILPINPVRRPAKNRAMTREEKRVWLRERLKEDEFWSTISDASIDAVCRGLTTPEVEE